MVARRSPVALAVAALLVLALGLRLWGIGFGLPSMYDHDEPLFMIKAFTLLKDRTLNPHWFGHPATTTIYSLALVDIGVFGWGLLAGWWSSVAGFTAALYADPGLAFLPARVMIALCGVAVVYLTYRLGRGLADARVGLVAALLVAVSPLHVEYSQIVRTDVQSGLFMLACLLATMRLQRGDGRWALVWAGIFAGLACATKWPAALVAGAPLAVCLVRRDWTGAALLAAVSFLTLFAVSPFLLLDWQTVVRNLHGEARPEHLGATGGGFGTNLLWYGARMADALGLGAALLAVGGLVVSARRLKSTWPMLLVLAASLVLIATRPLIWERWLVPLVPMTALFAAIGVVALLDRLRRPVPDRRVPALALVAAVATLQPLWATATAARMRLNDTRDRANAWLFANVPRTATITLEHLDFALLTGGWSFRFPLGDAGCVDARRALAGRIDYRGVHQKVGDRPMLSLGTMDAARLPTCVADYAVFTEYDRFLAGGDRWARERVNYERLVAGRPPVAMFRPERGVSAGPVVRIYRLSRATGTPGT